MKNPTFFQICMVLFLMSNMSYAQVGIGTTAPEGILDIDSSIYGVVYPSVALTATNVEAPVVNPLGGGLAIGTTVYNTNTTSTGTKDVEPGIFAWDGTQWVIQYFKRQTQLYKQTSSIRTSSNAGFEDIPGLGVADAISFFAKYNGLYKIELKVNYGGGEMTDNGDINTAMAEGDFRFIFDGTTYMLSVDAFSTYNDHIGGGTNYVNVWMETFKTFFVNLTKLQFYDLSLEFDQNPALGFVNSGDSGNGRGYVGDGIPCYIEITYLEQ